MGRCSVLKEGVIMVAADPRAAGVPAFVREPLDARAEPAALPLELEEAFAEIESVAAGVARMLAAVMQSQDPETAGHLERVSVYGMRLASAIDPTLATGSSRFGFLLHDVGKVAVPAWILRKPGPLTTDEWRRVRAHPAIGAELLGHVPAFGSAVGLVRAHHERWDGRGYPDGLRGEKIPLLARIFSVVDCFDAIISHRPYRPARSRDEAADEIAGGAGTQFDPVVADAFLRLYGDGAFAAA